MEDVEKKKTWLERTKDDILNESLKQSWHNNIWTATWISSHKSYN